MATKREIKRKKVVKTESPEQAFVRLRNEIVTTRKAAEAAYAEQREKGREHSELCIKLSDLEKQYSALCSLPVNAGPIGLAAAKKRKLPYLTTSSSDDEDY